MPVDFYDKYQVKERWTLGCENVLDAFMFRWLTFGDGVPGVDAAKQANNEVTNIAILAALGLTIVLPMLVEPNDDLGDEELHWQTLLWFSSFVSLFMSLTFAIVLLIAVAELHDGETTEGLSQIAQVFPDMIGYYVHVPFLLLFVSVNISVIAGMHWIHSMASLWVFNACLGIVGVALPFAILFYLFLVNKLWQASQIAHAMQKEANREGRHSLMRSNKFQAVGETKTDTEIDRETKSLPDGGANDGRGGGTGNYKNLKSRFTNSR